MTTPILEVTDLTRSFGGLAALSNVDLTLQPGELVGLIGPNGAGKTTAFNLLTGVYPPSAGTIKFTPGENTISLGGRKPYDICRAGVGRTFQNIRLFKDLSVLDNVVIAMEQAQTYSLISSFFHTPAWSRARAGAGPQPRVPATAAAGAGPSLARNLSYGERAPQRSPGRWPPTRLLLLDEPAAGMSPPRPPGSPS